MPKTSNVFARVEPELKEQSESILSQLGIPMSNAITLFLRQIVLSRGLPFEVKLPEQKPTAFGSLSDEDFNAEMDKGFADIAAGRMRPAADVFADLKRDYYV